MATASLAEVPLDDIGPERILHFYEPRSRMRAVLVIDTMRFGLTAGGVRMAADLSLGEMARLARAMTYKFAMLELPCGGAKSGIWLDPSDPARRDVLQAFLEAIRPLVDARQYLAGADMGTSATDFAPLYAASGRRTNLSEEIVDGMPLEDQVTGYGVVVAAKTACEMLDGALADTTVAVEGLGKVGAGVLKFLAREKATVVAVSNILGTLHDADGLDVERLLSLRREHGERALEHYADGPALLPRESLFAVEAGVVIPGARPDAIDMATAKNLRAAVVVPAANIPYAGGVADILAARGIVALPDFVTNAGGVLVGLVELQGGNAEDAFAKTRERIDANVRMLFDTAAKHGCSAYEAGLRTVRERLRH